MRLGWQRSYPALSPSIDDVAAMVGAALSEAAGITIAPVDGGLANTNLRIDLAGPPHRVLLRLYQRDAGQAPKEAALAELFAGHVPVPRFLHIGRHERFRFAVLEWVDGERLERVLDAMPEAARTAIGREVGMTLARIHAHHYAAVGFLDGELKVALPVKTGPEFFLGFLRQSFIAGQAHALLGDALARAAMAYAETHAALEWPGSPCLIHSDFNGSNILVRDGRIAAVVDWEFAMSARPDADFGNLLRNLPDEAFLSGVVAGYERESGGTLPANWRTLARNSDLVAWADILSRRGIHESVVAAAKVAIAETVGSA